MLAPLLTQKSGDNIYRLDRYFSRNPAEMGESDTFSNVDMFWRLASVGNAQDSSPRLELSVSRNAKLSQLEKLPTEMLDGILDQIFEPHDLINLGVCSRTLFACAVATIRSRFRGAAARWSNTPLICPYTLTNTLPPAIHDLYPSIEAEKRMRRVNTGRDVWDRSDVFEDYSPARTWVYEAYHTFQVASDQTGERRRWLDAIEAAVDAVIPATQIGARIRARLERALPLEIPQPGDAWVLRNLTIKAFVRFDILDFIEDNEDEYVKAKLVAHIKGVPWLSLDKAFLTRTFWCKEHQDDSEREFGEWAGHCFDIVPSDELPPSGWTDATEEVVNWTKEYLKLEGFWQQGSV